MRRIAIQGIKGSFHDIASHRYFEGEDLDLICCDTFEQVFRHLKEDKDAAALVAIENTIARNDHCRRAQTAYQPQYHVSA